MIAATSSPETEVDEQVLTLFERALEYRHAPNERGFVTGFRDWDHSSV
jgi:hypothetical protein